ncbi:MAG: ABC transporter substrate-binding protein [Thermomicrobiales bacterium]|nr:ABC transporter substrate-binding protein [Thermomicrobiales bacterium]
MENLPSSAIGAINHGVIAYREGRLGDARALFARALQADPESERAWLWFATVADDPAEQRYCLRRALEINPESVGLQRLALLPPGPETVPPEVRELDQPPLPPDLAEAGTPPLPLLPRSTVVRRQRARAAKPRQQRPAEPVAAGVPATPRRWPLFLGQSPPWFRWLLLGLALAVIAGAAALALLREPHPAGEPYTIAYAGPLSGPDAASGHEQLNAIAMAIVAANQAGGIDRHPLEVLAYDDQNDPALAADRAREIAGNDRILLVIGHDNSDASLAAAPIYEQAGIPAISPASTADILTTNHPWYFRSIFTNHHEGELIAAYSQHALHHDRASVVSTNRKYESSLARAFSEAFGQNGTIVQQWTIDPEHLDDSVAAIVREIGATKDPGILFLALQPAEAHALLLGLGRAGIRLPMIAGDAIGYQDFTRLFANEPEVAEQPGFFTNGLYAASPIIYDSLGGAALDFSQRYREIYGEAPDRYGAKAYDAATLAIHALAEVDARDAALQDIAGDRMAIRNALVAMDSPERSIPGLSGPLYFDDTRSVPQSMSVGLFDLGALLSAPLQYRIVAEPARFDLAAERANGLVFDIDGHPYRQYRVAYVGVDLNTVANLDARAETFDADFFLWFRYTGDTSAEDVFFSNATNPEMRLPDPIDRTDDGDKHFAMYRVNATFTDPMDFQDFPWDTHVLTLSMQNVTLTQNDIVYVPDQANIQQSQAERMRSGANASQPFNRIPSWIVERVYYAQDTATMRSTTPDPRTGAPEFDQVSTYQVQMTYGRNVTAFLVKNLLPLALLALVTYISLYFSPTNATGRITFSITSVLTASVMLQSISNSLPDVGYTVAIEWGYYVFIALTALLVLINISIERLYKAKRFLAVSQLDWIARVVYPLVLLIVVVIYAVKYG